MWTSVELTQTKKSKKKSDEIDSIYSLRHMRTFVEPMQMIKSKKKE